MNKIQAIYNEDIIENYAIYRDDFDCIIETLSYTYFLQSVRRRDIKTLYNKCISLLYWYNYLDEIKKEYNSFFTLQEQLDFISILENKENKGQLEKIYINGKQKHVNGLSKKTIDIHISNLREYYEFLYEHDFIKLLESQLPFRRELKIKIADKKTVTLPETLTMDEVRTLIAACTTLRDKSIIVLMVSTGLRLGELCALKMESLDFKKKTIHLRHQYLDLENGVLKTGERELKGTAVAFSLLQRYILLERNAVATCDNLFVTLNNRSTPAGSPLQRGSIQKLFARLRKKTGIVNCHAHVLRHTFATHFLQLREKNDKISLEMLRKLLGHKQLSTTLVYTHLDYVADGSAASKGFEDFINNELRQE